MNTIAAISTAQGIGGIGTVRISGENATEIADKVFFSFDGKTKLKDLKGYRAKYGKIQQNGEFIDDAVALVFRKPHSYTGEDVVEITCHGGLFLVKRLLRAVLENGAKSALPGEFTKRAFLNGKMDLTQAESVMDLISAKNARANQIAFSNKEGETTKKIEEIKQKIINISASISVWVDYPEEDIPELNHENLFDEILIIKNKVEKMISNYDLCKVVKNGIKTAIIGQPNVGKSTLMNLLVGEQKSIVTDIAGTTRDVIEETVNIGEIPLILLDTAGIRETENVVEKIGVQRAKKCINDADVVLILIDASAPPNADDIDILEQIPKEKMIIIFNKIDIKNKQINNYNLHEYTKNIVEISAATGKGIEDLKKVIENFVGISKIDPAEAMVSNERQLESLKKINIILNKFLQELKQNVTLDALTILLQDVLNILMEFTGERVSEEVVNRVFSQFCVGK